jgi:hypothetical protein
MLTERRRGDTEDAGDEPRSEKREASSRDANSTIERKLSPLEW